MSNRKKREALPRDLEIRGAEIFGKHLSPEKQRALLIVTLTACALPMILGVRMWDRIPEIVETGLIGPGGQDDSLPRWAVALLLPGLMCLLEAVAQFMLLQYQKRMKIPPAFNRLMGRWGFPTISLLFCSGAILETSGQGLSLNFYTPCILGLGLVSIFPQVPQNAYIIHSAVHVAPPYPLWSFLVLTMYHKICESYGAQYKILLQL